MASGEESAADARLRYVSDTKPGISRRKFGKGFAYFNAKGERITDQKIIARIKSLVIPPAYQKVWICPLPNGHIQATGFDERGRKQYRYHPRWRSTRDEVKFGNLLQFGETLPRIREHIERDLRKRTLCREKVLATVITLLERTHIRIGNAYYAKANKSFGLTTLRKKHVVVENTKLVFQFTGKSGKEWNLTVDDRRIIRTIRECSDLPGYDLFKYQDEHGARHVVSSQDVNLYLKEITESDFTAKDFRTWAGSVLALDFLCRLEAAENAHDRKKNIVQAIKAVSEKLKNTPAVCRSSYVHPVILEHYSQTGSFAAHGTEEDAEALLLAVLRKGAASAAA